MAYIRQRRLDQVSPVTANLELAWNKARLSEVGVRAQGEVADGVRYDEARRFRFLSFKQSEMQDSNPLNPTK